MFGKNTEKDQKLTTLLNQAIAGELQVTIQYMWQHVMVVGKHSASIAPIFQQIAMSEMKHAESVAERLNYLGGEPTTKPNEIHVGHDLDEMLKNDMKSEEETIELYKQIIEKADEEKDYVTRELFEQILTDEESHHDTFTKLLEK